ncbi:hypothetical protein [Mesorhizobium silamurunense]|nr:hypothetical protein [Mesorhizobium silamurunense]
MADIEIDAATEIELSKLADFAHVWQSASGQQGGRDGCRIVISGAAP